MTGKYELGIEHVQKVDFYIIKGIAEELLDYLGYKNRYSFVIKNSIPEEFHPWQVAEISVNNDIVGILGKLHPEITKEDVYVMEINLDKLLDKKVGKMKYKEISKFPRIKKDLALVVDKAMEAQTISKVIKQAGGKLLIDIEVFDVYTGEHVGEGRKSIAYALSFGADDRTLTDEEINNTLNKIILATEKELNAELRK